MAYKTFHVVQVGVLAALFAVAPMAWSQHLVGYLTPTDRDTTPAQDAALKCLGGTTGSLSGSPLNISYNEANRESITLTWAATIPSTCTGIKLYITNQPLALTGSMKVYPAATARWTLRATSPVGTKDVASVQVTVGLPNPITITTVTPRVTMIQALGTPGQTVLVNNDVNMDLSYMHILIANNVLFKGGRTSRIAGPRFFTTVTQPTFFEVVGDNVRITGLRIEGAEMGVADGDNGAIGVFVNKRVNVEIDHNEISGWRSAGVMVWDGDHDEPANDRINSDFNPHSVRIHDNFIHHNQHVGSEGYGVAVQYGAHAVITRNVFDWNRHAIEGDGRPGTGYEATHNLVLKNGGLHRWIPFPGLWVYTHQFDMHGDDNCGVWDIFSDSLWNCGHGGKVMYIRNNTFLYTNGPSIKLRGVPSMHMYVGANVFAHPVLVNTYAGGQTYAGTVQQTVEGLFIEPGNVTDYDGSAQLGSCDFDGDGVEDYFMATGVTWWFSSGKTGPWNYLNASTKRLSEVQLGHVNGDNRCDVVAGGVVYSGGMPLSSWLPANPFNGTFTH